MFDSDYVLSDLYVSGEISNFKRHTSGHIYFTLKDENAAIGCAMFYSDSKTLKFEPQNGMKVTAYGGISVYEKNGAYQLYTYRLEQCGYGALYARFEMLKQKLINEGLFDSIHKKTLPQYPQTIAVITSPTGAAVRDIIQVADRRNHLVKLMLFPVLVQGDKAAAEISAAIETVNRKKCADIIIVGRGGGSIEDLWTFNEEIVARSIFASEIPVISAVGHETDYTIADFVADMRAPTPSAAAELAVPELELIWGYLQGLKAALSDACISRVRGEAHRLALLKKRCESCSPSAQILIMNYKLQVLKHSIAKEAEFAIQKRRLTLAGLAERLEALSPLLVMRRGYSLVYGYDNNDSDKDNDNEQRLLTNVNELKVGEDVTIKMNGGEADARIISTRAARGNVLTTGV